MKMVKQTTIISPQNPYETNENDKLLEQIITTTISIPTTITEIKTSSDSLLLNYEDENNKEDNNEVLPKNEEMAFGNEAVKKEKLKEKVNTSENEEMKNNCEDTELREIVEKALISTKLDNLEAARNIESNSAAKFGGRFNSIVSNSEFAYVNWYGKRNCQLRVGSRHSLTWED
uniref:Ground-like domain-containing protein n=1 Tax=Meloidogyne enterolobii TaxID=390850 RepID=A0A6V7VQ97_MELEN|nr:unnamed protein product [Meloidogyne enterolobii]